MKLLDITQNLENFQQETWEKNNYKLPNYNISDLKKQTKDKPTWLHFGAGNIFRAFPAAVLHNIIEDGKYNTGVIVAEGFDFEIIDKAYTPYDNLNLLVTLKGNGDIQKKIVSCVTESLKASPEFETDWNRLQEIFEAPSLQMISFTITEKGYSVVDSDLELGLKPNFIAGRVALLMYKRFLAGKYPVTLQSMDNCSHNGDKLKNAILKYAEKWNKDNLVENDFIEYLNNKNLVTYPWSMIDKITPRPDSKVQEILSQDGFEDTDTIITSKNTYTAPFVNAEETEYLVIEDNYTNGRPPLELGGVLYAERDVVDKVERMKVCTCLNPLHTAMSIYGCMLGYDLISAEMKDDDIKNLITKIGYVEAMPVVVNPKVIDPKDFIDAVLTKRLPNPFIQDAPQRIATDTSQKLAIRFGETIKAYKEKGLNLDDLNLIPLVLAGYARYLVGIDDNGETFEQSPDPLLDELKSVVSGLRVVNQDTEKQDFSCLKELFSNQEVFGVDLYEVGLGEKIENMTKELFNGTGAIRKTLNKYAS